MTFFAKNINQAEWRAKELSVGRRGIFSGKVGMFNKTVQFVHPDYQLFEDTEAAQRQADALKDVPIPIYPATSAVQSWQFAKIAQLPSSLLSVSTRI